MSDRPSSLPLAIGVWRTGVLEVRALRDEPEFQIRRYEVARPENLDRVAKGLDDAGWNVYFGVNPRRAGELGGRDKLAGCVTCHVDLDEPNDEALRTWTMWWVRPSVLVSSGKGWHCYWPLEHVSPDIERVELANARLSAMVGADACWDASRILRLPGTTNRPDARKRAKGRVPLPVKTLCVQDKRWSLEFLLEQTAHVEVDMTRPADASLPKDLDKGPAAEDLRLLVKGRWGASVDKGFRSHADYNVAVDAYLRGGTDDQVARLLWHAPWQKAREAGSQYLRLTLAKAKAEAARMERELGALA